MSLVDLANKIWVPIFVHPKAVNNLKKGVYSPLEANVIILHILSRQYKSVWKQLDQVLYR